MNEDQLLEVFNAIQDQTGFSLGKFDKFSAAMQDPQKAGQIFDAIQQQTGFSLGKREKFVYTPTQQGPEKPAETVKEVDPTYTYQWSKPEAKIKNPEQEILNPDYATSQQQGLAEESRKRVKTYADTVRKSERAVSGEVQTIESPMGEQTTLPIADEFVAKTFEKESPQVQEAISRYIASTPEAKAILTNSSMTDKQKAELVEKSLHGPLNKAGRDLETLQARIDLKEGSSLQALAALLEYEPKNEQEAAALAQKLKEYEGSDELKYMQTLADYQARFAQYTDVVKKYPEELKRRDKLKSDLDAVKILPTDSNLDKAVKVARSTVGAVQGSVLDGVINLVQTSKALSDLVQSAGRDVDTYDPSDMVAESIVSTMDSWKWATDTETSADKPLNYIPATAKTLADMAVMFLGAKGARALGAGQNTSLVLSGMNAVYGDTYETMRDSGLDDNKAARYATGAALIQGLLERVSPQNMVRKNVFKDAVETLGEDATEVSIFKHMLKDVPAENLQEFMQSFADMAVNWTINSQNGTALDQSMDAKEAFDQIALTTAATALMGGMSGKVAYQDKKREAAEYLKKHEAELRKYLQENIENGVMNASAAANILAEMELNAPTVQEQAESLLEEDPVKIIEVASDPKNDPEVAKESLAGQVVEIEPEEGPKVEVTARKGTEAEITAIKTEPAKKPEPTPQEGEKVQYEGETFNVVKKSRGKLVLQSEDGQTVVRDVPQFEVTRTDGPTVMTAEEFKNRKNEGNKQKRGTSTPKVSKSNETKAEASPRRAETEGAQQTEGEPVRGPENVKPTEQPKEVTVDNLEQSIAETTSPVEEKAAMDLGIPEVTARPSREVETESFGELTEVDRNPQVGDVVEFDGQNFEVTKAGNGKFDLRSEDKKGGAKNITRKEITKVYERTGQNQTTVEPAVGKTTSVPSNKLATAEDVLDTVTIKGNQIEILERGKDFDRIRLNGTEQTLKSAKSRKALEQALAAKKAKETLQEKGAKLKDTFGKWIAPGAVYDPKNELQKDVELLNALKEYAVAWVNYVGKQGIVKFTASIPKEIREQVSPDMIEAAYAGADNTFERAVAREKETEAQKGDKQRKSVKNINKQAKAEQDAGKEETIDPEIRKKINDKGLRYFTEPLSVTNAAVDELLRSVPIDKVAKQFKEGTEITPAMRTLLGIKLLQRYNKMAKDPRFNNRNARENAAEIAEVLVELGTEYGRAINAFKALTLLTPEGIQVWAEKNMQSTKDRILKRHERAIQRVISKVQNAEAKAAQQIPVNQYGIAKLKQKKQEALNEFKKLTMGQAGAAPNPAALLALAKYGFYAVAEGATTLAQFVSKLKKAGISKELAENIWHYRVNGQTLAQHAAGQHLSEVREALGTERLAKVLEKYGYDESVADEFNKQFARKVKENLEKTKRRNLASSGLDGRILNEILKENGPYTQDVIEDAMLRVRGFTGLTPEVLAELTKRAQKMDKLPEGFLRNEEAQQISQYLATQAGSANVAELAISYWYASILSSPATQIVNFVSNVFNVFTETMVSGIQDTGRGRPDIMWKSWVEGAKGFRRGWLEGAHILKTGKGMNARSSKFFEANPLEGITPATQWKAVKQAKTPVQLMFGLMGLPFSAAAPLMKFVPRAMSAADTFFYYSLYNHRTTTFAMNEAARIAKRTGRTRQQEYETIMGGRTRDWAEAEAKQEATELAAQGIDLSPRDIKRRAIEILEQQITDPRVGMQADRFASRGTFNYPPEGLLGILAQGVNLIGTKFPPFRFIVPFTNIVSNVINQQLDYTPLGILRAARVSPTGIVNKVFQNELAKEYTHSNRESGNLALKGFLGTALWFTIANALWWDEDDDTPNITGRGPQNPGEYTQWLSQGNKPYTVRIRGEWYSYQYTPIALVLTTLGNAADALKYGNVKDKKVIEQVQSAIEAMPSAFLEMSFLKGMAEFVTSMSDEKRTGSYFERFKTRTAASFAPRILGQIDRAMDPTIYRSDEVWQTVKNNIPFAIHSKPLLNQLGEPVIRDYTPGSLFLGWDRFKASGTPDEPVMKFLAEKEIFLPPIGKRTKVAGVYLGDDPELYRDYTMIVGQLTKRDIKAKLPIYQIDPKASENIDKQFKRTRDLVKAEYAAGYTTEQIVKKYGLVKY